MEHRLRNKRAPALATVAPLSSCTAIQPYIMDELRPEPTIIPRPRHRVSRKNMDREALKVLYRLKDHGYIAYLVGGSVRDLLLGRKPKDFDIGTNARPEEIRKLFRYSRIIGKRFRLVHVYFRGGKIIEVSTFRKQTNCDDREAEKEGLSCEQIFGTPQEDAFRRDLTINGLFYNISDFSIIDYVGGMADLKAGIIRAIGDPEQRLLRDPVRMMRAVRHAARTGFAIEPATWDAIVRHRNKIRLCAIPRVRDEWLKDMKSGASKKWAELMISCGMFTEIFPGYAGLSGRNDWPRVKKLLLGMLGELDQFFSQKEVPEESLLLATLAYPWLHYSREWRELKAPKVRWPSYEVRLLIRDLFAPYDFRRMVRDMTAQILASQWPIRLCIERDSWPKRVWNKATFKESVMLHNMIQKALGGECISLEPHRARVPVAAGRPKSSKRRYRRKRRNRRPK